MCVSAVEKEHVRIGWFVMFRTLFPAMQSTGVHSSLPVQVCYENLRRITSAIIVLSWTFCIGYHIWSLMTYGHELMSIESGLCLWVLQTSHGRLHVCSVTARLSAASARFWR